MNSGARSAASALSAEGADATDVDDARRVRDLIDGYPEVLTPVEAAVLLRTSASTMGRLIRTGDVPATKVGGRWRLLKSALLEFLAASGRP
jgi:excisionase family DNA binding protein